MNITELIYFIIILSLLIELVDKDDDYINKYLNRIKVLRNYFAKFIDFIKFIHDENPLLLDYYDEDDDYYNKQEKLLNDEQNEQKEQKEQNEEKKQEQKKLKEQIEFKEQEDYSKKYLKKYINFTNDYFFTNDELNLKQCKYEELCTKHNLFIDALENEIWENKLKLSKNENIKKSLQKKYENGEMEKIKFDLDNEENYSDEVYDDYEQLETLSMNIENLSKKITEIKNQIKLLKEKSTNELMDEANQYVIDNKLNNFINNYVIEYTPIGNVAMRYNHSKGTFEYFSNRNVPYNYLEVVGRKYVTTFGCKSIFVNMDEEIEKVNELNEKNKQNQQCNKKEEKNKNLKQNFLDKDGNNLIPHRPNQQIIINPINNMNIIVKNSNRYTHEGRFCDFKMNKPINNKEIDKNLKLSFKDFKKLKQ